VVPVAELPQLPLSYLRCSRSEPLRALLERQSAWSSAVPGLRRPDGERGITCYRIARESFFVQVHWRWSGGQWQERDFTIVPGTIVALRLVLDGADPARISALLDVVPTRAFAKGDTDLPARRIRDEGLWIHEVLPNDFLLPEEKVAELLGMLRGHPGWREVLRLPGIAWHGITVQMRGCQERMGGFALDPRTLEDLVGMSLQLDLEVIAE